MKSYDQVKFLNELLAEKDGPLLDVISGAPKAMSGVAKDHANRLWDSYTKAAAPYLKPTRNASSPAISACDAVSVAMNTLPVARGLKPNSFNELAKIYAEAEKSGAFVS
jgi:hypothetical protein